MKCQMRELNENDWHEYNDYMQRSGASNNETLICIGYVRGVCWGVC